MIAIFFLFILFSSTLQAMSKSISTPEHLNNGAHAKQESEALPCFNEELSWETKRGILQDLIKHVGRIFSPLISGKANSIIGKQLSHSQALIIMNYALEFKTLQPTSELEIDEQGNSPLHEACRYANFDVIELLLNAKADVTILNNANEKPIDILLQHGITMHNQETYPLICSVVQRLLSHS